MADPTKLEEVRQVMDRNKSWIIEQYGAVGAGIGKADPQSTEYVIVVYLETNKKFPEVTVEDIRLVFKVTGKFELH